MRAFRKVLWWLPIIFVLLLFSPLPTPFSPPVQAATVRLVALPKAGDGKALQHQIVALALKTGPGDELQIFDAQERKHIAAIAIPDDPKYARVERRVSFLVQAMRDLKAYTDAMPAAKPGEPAFVHAVAFMDEVGTIMAKYPNQDIRVLILGSAWFTAPGATERADYRGTYPSDGLILDDRAASPFGTSGLHDLTGVAVTYCFTERTADFLNPNHRDRVERAWSLEVEQRGGSLVTFTGDQKSCWESFAGEGGPQPRKFTVDPEDARVKAMYRSEDAAPRIMKAPSVKTVRSTPAPAEASKRREAARFRQRASSTPPNRRDGTAWLGIQWVGDGVDLDLFVRCNPGSPFLYYGNQRSAEGRHNFDYRSGTGDGFETVDLTASCPDITKAEVLVNFYSGSLRQGPKGTFAIEFAGKFFKSEFAIEAKTGNQGALNLGLPQPPHWVRINLATVLGLPPVTAGRVATGIGPLK